MAKKKKLDTPRLTDEEFTALLAECRRVKSPDEQRFIFLGWKLMEAKFRYYKQDAPELEDHVYDAMEREYDTLAKKLGVAPTAVDMVGFDQTRPSGALVADKILGRMAPKVNGGYET